MSGATNPTPAASVGILHFLRFLREENSQFSKRLIIVSTISGLAQAFVAGMVVYQLGDRGSEKGIQFQSVILYGLILIAAYKLKQYTLHRTAEIIENTMYNIRLRIVTKIRRASLSDFEMLKNSTLYTALTTNAGTISQASSQIISSASSAIMVIFAALIIAFLSPMAFFIIFGSVAVGAFLVGHGRNKLQVQITDAVEKEREFFSGLNDLLEGFKELKINDRKCGDFFEQVLEKKIHENRDLRTDTAKAFANITVFGGTYIYIILGSVFFLLPAIDPEIDELVPALISVTIFTMGPLLELINASSLVGSVNAAVDSIKQVETSLDDAVERNNLSEGDAADEQFGDFENLVMSKAAFTYPKVTDHAPFHFGPVNFELNKGEIVFLVGANGSGKTTFLKLITGLYYPESGAILKDGTQVIQGDVAKYRGLFSTIFSDFHLFSQLYGLNGIDEKEVEDYLDLTEMKGVTTIKNGRISNLSLSTGQRKRVGLVCALLEKRPILVFDELAADQDPVFRQHFYEKILPGLARKGLTVLAASHDEQYFYRADRVVKIENGDIHELPDKKYR